MATTYESWARALTGARLAQDLLALAGNVRHFSGDQRAALLAEAARRLTTDGAV